jgi:hypothetical protein
MMADETMSGMADEMVEHLAAGGGFDDRVLKTMSLHEVRTFLALVVERLDQHLLEEAEGGPS